VADVPGLIAATKDYYRRNHIQPATYGRFECPDKEECRDGVSLSRFACGNEPLIGSQYERRVRPRLLIISAEAAEGDSRDPGGRTIEGHGRWWEPRERTQMNVGGIHPRTHWFKTAQTAVWFFEVTETRQPSKWAWKSRLRNRYGQVAPYWAHTNSGKCSQSRPNHQIATAPLFRNCRKYIGREIRLLAPDIIVSQGTHARDAIGAAIEWNEIEVQRGRPPFKIGKCYVLLAPHCVLWIPMHHPNSRGLWYELVRNQTVNWAKHICDFLQKTGWGR
jgi:hypothetical protein